MIQICPVCNGLIPFRPVCAYCQVVMLDYGQLQSYLDPYAPFEEDELVQQGPITVYEGYCQHLTFCSRCKRKAAVKVPLIAASTISPYAFK